MEKKKNHSLHTLTSSHLNPKLLECRLKMHASIWEQLFTPACMQDYTHTLISHAPTLIPSMSLSYTPTPPKK